MASKNNRNTKHNYYVDGSTVRKMDALPVREYDRSPKRNNENNVIIRKRKIRRVQRNSAYRWMLVLSICVTVIACIIMTRAEMKVVFQYRHLQSLKSELAKIEHENTLLYEEINAPINLDAIYKTATKNLKMIYPTKNNIIYYEDNESSYVRKENSIPKDVKNKNPISGVASFILQGR